MTAHLGQAHKVKDLAKVTVSAIIAPLYFFTWR